MTKPTDYTRDEEPSNGETAEARTEAPTEPHSEPRTEQPSETGAPSSSGAGASTSAPPRKGKLVAITLGGVPLYQDGQRFSNEQLHERVRMGIRAVLEQQRK